MEPLLLSVTVLLSVVICALGGFWFYRADQTRQPGLRLQQIMQRADRQDRWEGATRSARDRFL